MAGRQISEKDLIQLLRQEQQNLALKEEQVERLIELLRETTIAKDILEEAKKNKSGKMQINIGASVLIEVEAKDITNCKRAFAEHGYIEETTQDTIKWLTDREESFKAQFEKAQGEYHSMRNKVEEIMGILKQVEAEKKKMTTNKPFTISK